MSQQPPVPPASAAQTNDPPSPPTGAPPTPYSFPLALLSGSGILLEIALTRFFSTLFFPPYVFAVISVAILGIGLGAALATIKLAWRNPARLPLYLALAGYATLMLLLVSVWTAAIDLNGALFAVVLIPYLFVGLALATIFSAMPEAGPRLYRADLLGAGLGVILAIPVLNWLGGLNSLFLISGLFGVAALVADWANRSSPQAQGPVTDTASRQEATRIISLTPTPSPSRRGQEQSSPPTVQGRTGFPDEPDIEAESTQVPSPQSSPSGRGRKTSLPTGGIEGGQTRHFHRSVVAGLLCGLAAVALIINLIPNTRWLRLDMANLSSAKPITESLAGGGQIIRTTWDSFARTDLVDPGQARPYRLYIDGAAGSVMPPAGDLNLLRTDIGFFPFATNQPADVLVIGPGGGLDVWFALSGRAQSVTAIEINPASVEMVNDFAAYHGDLYGQPGVRVLVDEGRSVLRREDRRYDLIYLSQVVTLAAERSGYALTENTIYTVEAFADYLAHLQPGGQIAMKLYDELTLTRAVVTAAAALSQTRDISQAEAMAHMAVFLDPAADPPIPLLMVQAEPLAPADARSYAEVASRVDFAPLFVPGVTASPTLAGLLSGERSLADVIAASPSDISPTTDDRPFFYQFERGLPERLRPLLWGLGAVMLAGAVAVGFTQRTVTEPAARFAPIYFAALGAAFITVEIALIQQTRLFLGHPTLAVTTILGALLIGGGLGSDWAGRWPDAAKPGRLLGVILLIVLLALAWIFVWPWLSRTFLGLQTLGRVSLAVAAVLPLALLMGMPFPLGLWLVGRFDDGDRHVALAWAVNGVMTVAGSAAAVAIAMLAGFSTVLLVGAGAYAVAALVLFLTQR